MPHSNPNDPNSEASSGGGTIEISTNDGEDSHSPSMRCPACTHMRPVDACRYCDGKPPRVGPSFAPFDFARGFRYYWRGAFAVINEKEYLGRILAAIVLALVVFAGLLWVMIAWVHPMIAAWFERVTAWHLPSFFTTLIPAAVTILAAFFLMPTAVTAFLFPVLDPLARIAERARLGFRAEEHPRGVIADFWDSMDTAARIFGMQLVAAVVLIPVAGTIVGAPIAIVVAAFFAGFGWIDYPASRHQLDFSEKFLLARRHWALLVGYGTAFLIGLLIPFFNPCLVAPAGAVGSAELWLRLDKRGTKVAGESNDN